MIAILEIGTSLKFKHISENTNKLVSALLDNQDFLKWITHLEDDPLSMPDVSPQHILGNRLVLTEMEEKILTERIIKVFLTPFRGVPHKGKILADDIYELNITMPNEYSYIYPYRLDRRGEIARQVAISLDQQRVTGIGEVEVGSNYNMYKINETYVGMTLFITVTNGSTKEIV